MSNNQRIDVYLVCNARYHDTNFARLELLKLLAENEDINTRVAENFSDVDAIAGSKLLITYTCDLRPTEEEQQHLAKFLEDGGCWFALHATNALLEFVDGKPDTPDLAPLFMNLLGSRFVAHPPNQRFRVRVTDVDHALTRDLEDFDVEDEEPYYCEPRGDQTVLLEASYTMPSTGYVQSEYGTDRDAQPQMYLHKWGDGEVLYLSLGHCTGKHDMKPLADVVPAMRGSWNSPVYYELLRRGINWGIGELK
ncbi:MAG: ThuA domain-containing protein [Pseudomonadales bacterium]|nr:ThuA domain-containing protein [Pseudomonadales bacterium]MBO6564995.1 ThuA domain-containing protein [Pseudomonadales bacterium]MBO6597183.1 ThuA domain-containing protein [Pseudomonadales bacterium]MBO6655310.1 ThuA domain-containing protein [Pseudomonadales bacterium]MBO6703814.1 ThuA domain-containing protein [Pseudomonadales bacterium]